MVTISRRALLKCCAGSAVLGIGAGVALPRPARAARPEGARFATVAPPDTGPRSTVPAFAPADPASLPPGEPVLRPVPRHQSPAPTTAPRWAQRWPAPIRSIDDYTARCPRPLYPARAIMITVDDGPSSRWTPAFLDLFAEHGVVATFCLIGRNVGGREHLVRAIAEHGHTIANHTWTHDLALTSRPRARIRRELADTSAVIEDACGVAVRQFRAPGGHWGPALLDELAELRMMPLGWDVDPRDWSRPGTPALELAFARARRHDIVLCHDGGGDRSQTYAALQYALPRWKRAGYVFVTLPSPR
jgi:peptidoglycan/xylan/chitin deacetylase (PgdA/CDA1 family)